MLATIKLLRLTSQIKIKSIAMHTAPTLSITSFPSKIKAVLPTTFNLNSLRLHQARSILEETKL